MATAAQVLSNKKNAQESTGPRTAEGKRKSSLNSLRHGLTSQIIVLPSEDAAAYAALHANLWQDFAPKGSLETLLAQTLCDTQWRLERARNMEANLVALAHHEEIPAALAALTDPQQQSALVTAHGYDKRERVIRNLQLQEARLQRTFFKALTELRQAQATRRQSAQVALQDALNARTCCHNNKLPFNPQKFGFDFTEAELDRESALRLTRLTTRKMDFGSEALVNFAKATKDLTASC